MASPDPLASPTKIPLLGEKGIDTPATKYSGESPPPTPGRQQTARNGNSMEGATGALLWGAFGPCIPIVVVTSVLLTAVLYNRIPNDYVFLPAAQMTTSNQVLNALYGIQQIENNGGNQ